MLRWGCGIVYLYFLLLLHIIYNYNPKQCHSPPHPLQKMNPPAIALCCCAVKKVIIFFLYFSKSAKDNPNVKNVSYFANPQIKYIYNSNLNIAQFL
jgi:hypothetical protein